MEAIRNMIKNILVLLTLITFITPAALAQPQAKKKTPGKTFQVAVTFDDLPFVIPKRKDNLTLIDLKVKPVQGFNVAIRYPQILNRQ